MRQAANASTSISAAWRACARAGWVVLAVLHAAVLASVVTGLVREGVDGGQVANLLALLLTVVLFVLKAIDARFLRLRRGMHTLIAFTLVSALVHHDAIAAGPDPTATVATVVVSTTAATVAVLRRRRDLLHGLRRALRALLGASLPAAAVAFGVLPAACAVTSRPAPRPGSPRAPPARRRVPRGG